MRKEVSADIVVIGGGPAGVTAALSAARRGSTVSLVTDRPVLGGNSSSEIRVWTRGSTGGGNLYSEEMGVWGSLKLNNLAGNFDANPLFWDDVLLDAVLAEKKLSLFLNTRIIHVEMQPSSSIRKISGFQLASEIEYVFSGKIFIDATGDGFIGAQAGVPYIMGREAADTYGEDFAPHKKDSRTFGSSLFFMTKHTGVPVKYVAPGFALTVGQVEQLVSRGGRVVTETMNGCDYWWFEYGGQINTITDNQEITLELKKLALGVWNYIKNSGRFPAEDLTMEWIGLMPGKRESRRFITEYVLNLNDLVNQRVFPDAVAYGGWYLDFHPVSGVYTDEDFCTQHPVSVYPIPLSCMYSRSVDNLLFAGRDIGISHVVFASSRIMNTCALTGQAAGTAAAYCVSRGTIPMELSPTGIDVIRLWLSEDDGGYLGVKMLNPENLAPHAEISVSSRITRSIETVDTYLPLTRQWFVLICRSQTARTIHLRTRSDKSQVVKLHCVSQDIPSRAVTAQHELLEVDCTVEEGEGWSVVNLPEVLIGKNGFLTLYGNDVPGLELGISSTPLTGFLAGYQASSAYVTPSVRVDIAEVYGHGNLTDGLRRPSGKPAGWISAWEDESPTIHLVWEKPVSCNRVRMFLNPDLSMELPSSITSSLAPHHGFSKRQEMPCQMITSYTIETFDGKRWKKVVDIPYNHQRLRDDVFERQESVAEMRIIVRDRKSYPAEIFEIEVFDSFCGKQD